MGDISEKVFGSQSFATRCNHIKPWFLLLSRSMNLLSSSFAKWAMICPGCLTGCVLKHGRHEGACLSLRLLLSLTGHMDLWVCMCAIFFIDSGFQASLVISSPMRWHMQCACHRSLCVCCMYACVHTCVLGGSLRRRSGCPAIWNWPPLQKGELWEI